MDQPHELYAVTRTSLYRLGSESGTSVLEKRAMRENTLSRVEVGGKMAGSFIALTKRGIILTHSRVLVDSSGNPLFEECGDRTSPIVALFFKEEYAKICLEQADLTPFDSRWREQTKKVLQSIDPAHPFIFIPGDEYFSPLKLHTVAHCAAV
ncbi:MAG: hypothetical protein Q7S15_00490 [bacterium]|nr:hypothetical protein [bacterium]